MVHPKGAPRESVVAALSARSIVLAETALDPAIGSGPRLFLCAVDQIARVRTTVGPARPLIGLVASPSELGGALAAGADEVVLWPGSERLLRKRVAVFLDGDLGPSRIALDTRRVTSLVHAVRNPLNVITLYAELLKMEPLSSDAVGSVGRLVRAAKRVDALVGELETLLYLESGEAPVRCQATELGEIVQLVLHDLTYDVQDKPLSVEVDLADSGTLAMADPDLTRRTLHAVFGRVAKLSLGDARIVVHTSGPPPTVTIEAPIQPVSPDQEAAFHAPATELDAREDLGGVGVGLSFAHRALRAMEGRLEHDATPNGHALTRLVFSSP